MAACRGPAPSANVRTGLNRLIRAGILKRACRGIYANPQAHSFNGRVIERIAQALRPGKFSYVSLESMLSEYGEISQIPVDRLTVMTTGRKGSTRRRTVSSSLLIPNGLFPTFSRTSSKSMAAH